MSRSAQKGIIPHGPTPIGGLGRHGTLHNLFGALVFSLSPITCFVFLRRFGSDPRWRSLFWWTLAAGTIIVAAVVVQAVGPTEPPAAPNAFNAWVGLIQRVSLVTFVAWVFTFALALQRRTGRD